MFPSNFVIENIIISYDGHRFSAKVKTMAQAEQYVQELEKEGYKREYIDISISGVFN